MWYIQRKDGKDLETIDEFQSFKEARTIVKEYRIADTSAEYYISRRACKAWNKI